jgi:hypothetical protein
MRRLLVLLFLLPLHAFAQGAGTPPYRGVNNWNVIFGSDGAYDIGAVGATRPRNVYAAGGYFGTSATLSGLTATRCTFAGVGGLLSDDADCTFVTDTLTVAKVTVSTGPLIIPVGSAADNALRFSNNTANSGWRSASGDWIWSSGASDTFRLSPLLVGVGSALAVGAGPSVGVTIIRSNSIDGAPVKTLTESAATEFVRVAVPQTAGSNFAGGKVIWTAYATDTTNHQSITGESKFAAVNAGGTETCAAILDEQTATAASSGTLTCTITCVTGLTNLIGLAANCVSSLTQTTLSLSWRLDMPKTQTATAQ